MCIFASLNLLIHRMSVSNLGGCSFSMQCVLYLMVTHVPYQLKFVTSRKDCKETSDSRSLSSVPALQDCVCSWFRFQGAIWALTLWLSAVTSLALYWLSFLTVYFHPPPSPSPRFPSLFGLSRLSHVSFIAQIDHVSRGSSKHETTFKSTCKSPVFSTSGFGVRASFFLLLCQKTTCQFFILFFSTWRNNRWRESQFNWRKIAVI